MAPLTGGLFIGVVGACTLRSVLTLVALQFLTVGVAISSSVNYLFDFKNWSVGTGNRVAVGFRKVARIFLVAARANKGRGQLWDDRSRPFRSVAVELSHTWPFVTAAAAAAASSSSKQQQQQQQQQDFI